MWGKIAKWATRSIPASKAFFSVFLVTLVVSGFTTLGILYYQQLCRQRVNNPRYTLRTIAQESESGQILPIGYLWQQLNLEEQNPPNLYSLALSELAARLEQIPLFETAIATRIPPSTLQIHYRLRTPYAILADVPNTLLDKEGTAMAAEPFIDTDDLPRLFLGKEETEGDLRGHRLCGPHQQLAFEILAKLQGPSCKRAFAVNQLDVSQANAESYGKREVLLEIFDVSPQPLVDQTLVFPRILRLPPEKWWAQIKNYLVLRDHLNNRPPPSAGEPPLVIDLRIQQLAFFPRKF